MKIKEEWRPVKGWDGIYEISSFGRLKSFKDDPAGHILSQKNKTGWYLAIVLCASGRKSRSVKLHRLVAETFLENPENKPEVNHKDSNKQNNRADNLEWATKSENMVHAIENNPSIMRGVNLHNKIKKTRRIIQKSLDGKILKFFMNCVEAGRQSGVCSRNIHQVAAKTEYKPGLTRKQAGGYRWDYV